MGLQSLLAGKMLNLLKICKRLRGKEPPHCTILPSSVQLLCLDQRMHSVQVEIQYVYVAEALCEYGRAMKYIESPQLLEVGTRLMSTILLNIVRNRSEHMNNQLHGASRWS